MASAARPRPASVPARAKSSGSSQARGRGAGARFSLWTATRLRDLEHVRAAVPALEWPCLAQAWHIGRRMEAGSKSRQPQLTTSLQLQVLPAVAGARVGLVGLRITQLYMLAYIPTWRWDGVGLRQAMHANFGSPSRMLLELGVRQKGTQTPWTRV